MGWLSRDRSTHAEDAPRGEELHRIVRRIVEEEVGHLVSEGRVELKDEADGDPIWPGWTLELTPKRPDSTGISMTIGDDTVTFGTGGADAWDELWSITDHWDSRLRAMVCSVRDGRYRESVRNGLFFPLKVTMRFGGARPRGGGDELKVEYRSTLGSIDGDLPMPPTGEFEYAAW